MASAQVSHIGYTPSQSYQTSTMKTYEQNLPMSYQVREQSTSYVSTTGGDATSTSYEQSRRKVSSIVVSENVIGDLPRQDGVRYVEVPVVQEVVKHVPRREVIEREKIVPRVEYQYVDKIVEVPQIQYVDKYVDKPEIREQIVTVSRKEFVDVPREVVRHVPKIETVYVDKIVEVPGPVVEVEKPVVVENKVPVTKYQDKELPVIVAQTVQPVVVEGAETVPVDLIEYEPQVVIVDVHVAKPVSSQLIAAGVKDEVHRYVQVPAAQYNTILRTLNPHMAQSENQLPFLRENGQIPFLPNQEFASTVAPRANVTIEGYNGAGITTRDVPHMTTREGVTSTSRDVFATGLATTRSHNYGAHGQTYSGTEYVHGAYPSAAYTTTTYPLLAEATPRRVTSTGRRSHHKKSSRRHSVAAPTTKPKKACC